MGCDLELNSPSTISARDLGFDGMTTTKGHRNELADRVRVRRNSLEREFSKIRRKVRGLTIVRYTDCAMEGDLELVIDGNAVVVELDI